MRIKSVTVEDFKSFSTTGQIDLSPGFTVVVGQNNAGKTSLLRAMKQPMANVPHRSILTVPRMDIGPFSNTDIQIRYAIGGDELFDMMMGLGSAYFLPTESSPPRDVASHVKEIRTLFRQDATLEFGAHYHGGQLVDAELGKWKSAGDTQPVLQITLTPGSRDLQPQGGIVSTNKESTLPFRLAPLLSQRVYAFEAERLNIGRSSFEPADTLSGNASNLAQVLHTLQSSNETGMHRYEAAVQAVLPDILHISAPPVGNNQVETRLWSIPRDSERPDLAISLSESGTGVGQVLSLLYVVLISRYPAAIIIDEPQTFLHPGALRKLIEIFRQHSQHQYIVASHSPTVVTACNPQTLLMVRKVGAESQVQAIDPKETKSQRLYLSEIGARLSDVFGVDNILWVEGATEQECFPLILEQVAKRPLMGTAIIGVTSTSDLTGKDAKKVFDIYSRLSEGGGVLPPAVGFVFDRELRSDQSLKDLERQGRGKLKFLPRRMYENYLLDPEAIHAATAALEGFYDADTTVDIVTAWLREHQWDTNYISELGNGDEPSTSCWLQGVDGAALLKALFAELSETRWEYDKVRHGVQLTEWLIDNKPEELQEVADLLCALLDGAMDDRSDPETCAAE